MERDITPYMRTRDGALRKSDLGRATLSGYQERSTINWWRERFGLFLVSRLFDRSPQRRCRRNLALNDGATLGRRAARHFPGYRLVGPATAPTN
jgi:hypothetical protein